MINFKKQINSLIDKLDTILDFEENKQKKISKLIKEELPYLKKSVKLIGEDCQANYQRVETIQKDLESIIFMIENTTGDDKAETIGDYNQHFDYAKKKINVINRLLKQIDQPYFGKIEFSRKSGKTKKRDRIPSGKITTYIGKFAYFDPDTKTPLITDWRAPITNLYYGNSGPKKDISFETPVTEQKGDLTQKRQFEINEGRFTSIYESKSGNAAADSFLLSQLKNRTGKKLEDIVSTIQKEQNLIIREEINHPAIIQGVAGSGKTTIILHRIAYLNYTYKDELDSSNMLVIAPNKMFLDYISDVLPSLGVEQIEKGTYISFAQKVLDWNDKYIMSTSKDDLEVKKFKGSKQFIKIVQKYLDDFEKDILNKLPTENFKNEITERYYYLKKENPSLNMLERFELSIGYAFAQRKFRKQERANFLGGDDLNTEKEKELKQYAKKRLKPFSFYKKLFKFKYVFEEFNINPDLAKKVKTYSLENLKKIKGGIQKYKIEDLAPLLWIHYYMFGSDEVKKDYIIVDEAQDMSLFQIKSLSALAKKGNIILAGDIAQSIIPPFHLSSWDSVKDLMKEMHRKESSYHQLNRCYRTTIEIVNYANKLFADRLSSKYHPKAVLRHGDPVKELKYTDLKNSLKKLVRKIKEEGSSTIGVLCKDYHRADEVFNTIKDLKVDADILNYEENDYKNGILVLPISAAKGLEFDDVIIIDKDSYDLKKKLDVKLLYVAITRALHRLHILNSN